MACRLNGAKPLSEPMLDGILLIGPLGTNFNEILIGIQTFSFRKMHLKMSSAKWRPFCLGLIVLTCPRISLVDVVPGHLTQHPAMIMHVYQYVSIAWDNGLAPTRWQAIIGQFTDAICVTRPNELTHRNNETSSVWTNSSDARWLSHSPEILPFLWVTPPWHDSLIRTVRAYICFLGRQYKFMDKVWSSFIVFIAVNGLRSHNDYWWICGPTETSF